MEGHEIVSFNYVGLQLYVIICAVAGFLGNFYAYLLPDDFAVTR